MGTLPISDLQHRIRAEIIVPTHPAYERARQVWNAMIDRRPLLIAQPENAVEVAAAVRFAREHDLPLSVKGGGHGVAGKAICDDGVVIDLTRIADVEVDPELRIARVQGGATLRTFDAGAQAFGLATTAGVYRQTGVAGLTLGGGLGLLMRKYGLTCDNLLAAEVVTASGEILETNDSEHPDLFWGLRGGGGNFGVVTRMDFRLHPLTHVTGGRLTYSFDDALEIGRFYRDMMAGAPDDLQAYMSLGTTKTGPAISMTFCHSGSPGEAEAALAKLRSFRSPIKDGVARIPYLDMQKHWDDSFPDGASTYWKSNFLSSLSDDVLHLVIDAITGGRFPNLNVDFEHLGGCVSRVAPDATAFAARDAACTLLVTTGWTDPAEHDARIAWVRETWSAAQPYSNTTAYINYLDQGDDARTEAAFGPNFRRLAEIKRRYDPDNVFRPHGNILA